MAEVHSHNRNESVDNQQSVLLQPEPKTPGTVTVSPGMPHRLTLLQMAKYWYLEFLCFAGAALTLMAIIVVCAVKQDKALPQWPKLISINSLLSIFMSIFHALVLFPVVSGASANKTFFFFFFLFFFFENG